MLVSGRVRTRIPAFLLTICAAAATSAQPADRPNIIFIMSDDHAAHAISAYGSRVNQTPNLDRLARGRAVAERVRDEVRRARDRKCSPPR